MISNPFDTICVECPCGTKWFLNYYQLNDILYHHLPFSCNCGRVLQVSDDGMLNFIELPGEIEAK